MAVSSRHNMNGLFIPAVFNATNNIVNAIPVLGHVKGAVHYFFGDKDAGDIAIKSASHSSGVVAGGLFGMFIGGHVGAWFCGVGGGIMIDGCITLVDSKIMEEDRPYGYFQYFTKIGDGTMRDEDWFSFVNYIGCDCVISSVTGKVVNAKFEKTNINQTAKTQIKTQEKTFSLYRPANAPERGELYVWETDDKSWGHASLSLHYGRTYISFWPLENKAKQFIKFLKTNGKIKEKLPKSYFEDVNKFTLRPFTKSFVFSCNDIDTYKIKLWWKKVKKCESYHFLFNNCCDAVVKALKVGGKEVIIPKCLNINTPNNMIALGEYLARLNK